MRYINNPHEPLTAKEKKSQKRFDAVVLSAGILIISTILWYALPFILHLIDKI